MMKRRGRRGKKSRANGRKDEGEKRLGEEFKKRRKKNKRRGTTITFIVHQSANYSIIY